MQSSNQSPNEQNQVPPTFFFSFSKAFHSNIGYTMGGNNFDI